MTTNKKMQSKRRHRSKRHTNKMLKNKEKKDSSFSRRRHRRHRHRKTTVSSWDKHYTYESNIVNSEVSKSEYNNKGNNEVQAVHGLKDFLQGKKSTFNKD
jgi:hypothetical protein